MFCPAVTSSCPACPVEIPSSWVVARRGGADEPLELPIEHSDLSVESIDAAGDRAQR